MKFQKIFSQIKKEIIKLLKKRENLLLMAFIFIFGSYFFSWLKIDMFGYSAIFSGWQLNLGTSRSLLSFENAFGINLKDFFLFLGFIPFLGILGLGAFYGFTKGYLKEKAMMFLNFFIGILCLVIVVWNYLILKTLEKKISLYLDSMVFGEEVFLKIGIGILLVFFGGIILLGITGSFFIKLFKK